ncbi:major facilitator superfamily domain-containing protein [Stachybotrys elegans]|uniref:Major facilitator superfamily domain-containing protein n=1 Tax=Stachybotrys elegans TaxID=80388 RepID=A0A8K0WR81_9HYPO|nr:major facilitator superfamily domain-containing protein [Stachybotrys elegans]
MHGVPHNSFHPYGIPRASTCEKNRTVIPAGFSPLFLFPVLFCSRHRQTEMASATEPRADRLDVKNISPLESPEDTDGVATLRGDEESGEKIPQEALDDSDPNAVGWDGPDDPQNPMNWSESKKWLNVMAVSVLTLLTPLGSSMVAPGVPSIMRDMESTNINIATFIVSVYIMGFAFGPLVFAPMSELYGRVIIYHICNVVFIVFAVGTALSTNIPMLIIFRLLTGTAGSTPLTNGSGTIADMFPIEKRGRAIAVWAVGPLLGPCFGPVAGGYIVQYLNWHWVFWVSVIAGGVITVAAFFVLDETYAPTILAAKAKRLRKETGNPDLYSVLEDRGKTQTQHIQRAIARPMKMLIRLLPITVLALYAAVSYGVLYLMFSTFTFVFSQQYGFNTGTVGLAYLPTGIGMLIGVAVFGAFSDKIIQQVQAEGRAPTPEDRLPHWMTLGSGVCVTAGLFWYGWATEANTHWIVPMLGVSLFCFGLIGSMMCAQTYLVDTYVTYAASVIAALTVFRSLLGALLPLAGLTMYQDLGWGWGNSVLAFISLVLIPIPLVFRIWGPSIRAKYPLDF